MIDCKQRELLKPMIPFRYAKKVQAILRERNIVQDSGAEYSTSYITNIYNGVGESQGIEMAIWELYDRCKAQKDRVAKRLESSTKNKPEAATSGSN